jgi:hypothetical protein
LKNHPATDSASFTETSVKAFRVVSIFDSSGSDPVHGIGDDLESRFGVALPPDTKAFVLGAGRSVRVTIRFQPEVVGKFHQVTVLHHKYLDYFLYNNKFSFGGAAVPQRLSGGMRK